MPRQGRGTYADVVCLCACVHKHPGKVRNIHWCGVCVRLFAYVKDKKGIYADVVCLRMCSRGNICQSGMSVCVRRRPRTKYMGVYADVVSVCLCAPGRPTNVGASMPMRCLCVCFRRRPRKVGHICRQCVCARVFTSAPDKLRKSMPMWCVCVRVFASDK